jgi:hypothetical protein
VNCFRQEVYSARFSPLVPAVADCLAETIIAQKSCRIEMFSQQRGNFAQERFLCRTIIRMISKHQGAVFLKGMTTRLWLLYGFSRLPLMPYSFQSLSKKCFNSMARNFD